MKHWKTGEEIGEGFQHDEKTHKEYEHNCLINPRKDEETCLRTLYLIRDCWSTREILDLISNAVDLLPDRLDSDPIPEVELEKRLTEIEDRLRWAHDE